MIKKLFLSLVKYMSPLFIVLIPAMILYGSIYPWSEAKEVLLKNNNDYVLLIGAKMEYINGYEKHQNTYLVLQPSDLSSKTVFITVDSDGNKRTDVEQGGFLSIFIAYVIFSLLTWWFWFRKGTAKENEK